MAKQFGLPPLQQRKKQQWLQLLMRILSREDTHPALIESYDELMRHPDNFIQTRAQYHRHLTSMQTATCTTTAFYQRLYGSSGKAIKHCSVVQCRVATQHMTCYIRLYWPLSIDKLRIQLPETRTKNCFHWHKWGTPLAPLGSLVWTILRGKNTEVSATGLWDQGDKARVTCWGEIMLVVIACMGRSANRLREQIAKVLKTDKQKMARTWRGMPKTTCWERKNDKKTAV